jgi:hypothetical protein
MTRSIRVALATALILSVPSAAFADGRYSSASFSVHVALSLLGLVIAVGCLVEAMGVRKLALGGVVAEKMGLVVLAVICLSASALAEWGTNFVVDLTLEQVQLASEVLVIVAMALLTAYFYSVRSGMKSYLVKATEAMTASLESTPQTDSAPQAGPVSEDEQEGGRA